MKLESSTTLQPASPSHVPRLPDLLPSPEGASSPSPLLPPRSSPPFALAAAADARSTDAPVPASDSLPTNPHPLPSTRPPPPQAADDDERPGRRRRRLAPPASPPLRAPDADGNADTGNDTLLSAIVSSCVGEPSSPLLRWRVLRHEPALLDGSNTIYQEVYRKEESHIPATISILLNNRCIFMLSLQKQFLLTSSSTMRSKCHNIRQNLFVLPSNQMESQLPLPLTLDDASQLQPSTRTAHREEALWAAGRGTGNFLSRSFSSKKIQQLHHLNIRRNKRAIGDGFLRENRVTMAFVAGLKEENCYCGFVISVHLTYQSLKKL